MSLSRNKPGNFGVTAIGGTFPAAAAAASHSPRMASQSHNKKKVCRVSLFVIA